MTKAMTAAVAKKPSESTADLAQPTSVVTRMNFAASPAQVRNGLVFCTTRLASVRLLHPLRRITRIEQGGRYTLGGLPDGRTALQATSQSFGNSA